VPRGWSARALGPRGTLVRFYGPPREPIRVPAPAGSQGVQLREGRGAAAAEISVEAGAAVARLDPGEYLFEWRAA